MSLPVTIRNVENALKQTSGNVSDAARQLGVSRTTIYRKIEKSERLQIALQETREELVDIAKSKLKEKVEAGEMSAIFYTLNSSPEAKRQGWGQRQEVKGQIVADVSMVEMSIEEWRKRRDEHIASIAATMADFENDDG